MSAVLLQSSAFNFTAFSIHVEHGAELKKLNGAVMQTFLQLLDAATTGNEVEVRTEFTTACARTGT